MTNSALDRLKAAGRRDTFDSLLRLFEDGTYTNVNYGQADNLERLITDLLRELEKVDPVNARRLMNQFMLGWKSGNLADFIEDLEEMAPKPSGATLEEEEVGPERPTPNNGMVLDLPSTPGEDIWTARRKR